MSQVKTRFAPSPTGWLHIGGARTALFSWLYARRNGGKFLLRIEDTDTQRSTKEFEEEILDSMKWLGLDWDELEYQSERFDLYRQEAARLVKEGKAYEKDGATFIPVRFDSLVVHDLIRGDVEFKELPKEEEVIIKSDGAATFNFANVVDDSLMGVTHVVRGEDHLPNTPKQLLMYQALGYKAPVYAHLPMILAQEGGKMSKRHGATAVTEYRRMGYINKAIVNYLLLLGWSPKDDREILELKEAIEIFDLKDINKSNAKFDLAKLNWMNNQYLNMMPGQELAEKVAADLQNKGISADSSQIDQVIAMFKDRAGFVHEIAEQSVFLFTEEVTFGPDAEKVLANSMKEEFSALKEVFQKAGSFKAHDLELQVKTFCQAENYKVGKIFLPLRIALTGVKGGPGIFEIAEFLGKDKVLARIKRLIDAWS